jgi:hypothetical protein
LSLGLLIRIDLNKKEMLAVNEAQSKSVSIAFLCLKADLLGLVAFATAIDLTSNVEHLFTCNIDASEYFVLVRVLFALALLTDILALGYFFLCKTF